MLRASKRIIVISERVNRYSFRALIDGIDLAQFEANPVMLWMHNRAFGRKDEVFLPIGNVIELKKEVLPDVGYVITGQPLFDDTDEFAKSIYNKFENGTLRMASAGLIPIEWSEDIALLMPGQKAGTLVKSILEEISMVDIGADSNALAIALYNQNHELIQLSHNGDNAEIPVIKNPKIEKEMLKIELTAAKAAVLLGLKDVSSTDEFETKVSEVVQLAQSQKTQIETLTREKTEADGKVVQLTADLTKEKSVQLSSKIELMVQGAVDARKITADEKPHYVSLAAANYDTVEKVLSTKTGTPTVQTQLALATASAGATVKTWDDLDKSGKLVQLKADDPTLFTQLYKDKFGVEYKK
ncbi:hypothetical protein H7F33_05535 [Pedobacter sp. PAMC26386]|nr:hypothetical protein H7F33_05535 [Pedobacter sp. PAMC26386]